MSKSPSESQDRKAHSVRAAFEVDGIAKEGDKMGLSYNGRAGECRDSQYPIFIEYPIRGYTLPCFL